MSETIYIYIYTYTCIGFLPGGGWTGFLSSKYSIIAVYVAHWRNTLGFDWGKGPKSSLEKRLICRKFSTDALTEWPEAASCRNRDLLGFHQSPFSRVTALIPLGARPIRLGWPYKEQKFPTALLLQNPLPPPCHVEEGLDFRVYIYIYIYIYI